MSEAESAAKKDPNVKSSTKQPGDGKKVTKSKSSTKQPETSEGAKDKGPVTQPESDEEAKRSSLKHSKDADEDGAKAKKKPKKKKKKRAEDDAASKDNVAQIEDAASKEGDASAGKAPKKAPKNAAADKEGDADGKVKAAKKKVHPKASKEKLGESDAKDAIKGSKQKKKKKKPAAPHLPSSPVGYHPRQGEEAQLLQIAQGTYPAQGAYPVSPGMYPGSPGIYPAPPGMYPAPPGMYPAPPGMYIAGSPPLAPGQPPAQAQPVGAPEPANVTGLGSCLGALWGAFTTDEQKGASEASAAQQEQPSAPYPPNQTVPGYQRPTKTQESYIEPGYEELSEATYGSLPPAGEFYGSLEQAAVRQDISSQYHRRSLSKDFSERKSRGLVGADFVPSVSGREDSEAASRTVRASHRRDSRTMEGPHLASVSASRPPLLWDSRSPADVTQHIKYTAAVAENLRVASQALRRLQFGTAEEQRRCDFLASELMKRAALASSEVRRASMALAYMYPDPDAAGPLSPQAPPENIAQETATRRKQSTRALSAGKTPEATVHRASVSLAPTYPGNAAAGPMSPQELQNEGVVSPEAVLPALSKQSPRPVAAKKIPGSTGPAAEDKLQRAVSAPSKYPDVTITKTRSLSVLRQLGIPSETAGEHAGESTQFSFAVSSSLAGAVALPTAREASARKSLSSTPEGSGCDMCGGLWRGMVPDMPSEESSSPHIDEKGEAMPEEGPKEGLSPTPDAAAGDVAKSKIKDEFEEVAAEDYDVEAALWEFAQTSVHLFPESGIAVFFVVACVLWLAVVVFSGSAHHMTSTTKHPSSDDH
ncbi:hypothetical protein V5799_028167, partial [Amblyomma americanum]